MLPARNVRAAIMAAPSIPELPFTELSLHDVRIIFPPPFVARLHKLYACGNYGDPIVARDCLDDLPIFPCVQSAYQAWHSHERRS